MNKDNDFSFGGINNETTGNSAHDEYLDLLNEVKVEKSAVLEESRDIFSDSKIEQTAKVADKKIYMEDIYSNSDDDPDDIFTISDEPVKEYEDVFSNSDVFMSRKKAVERQYEERYTDIPISQRTRPVTPTAIRNPRMTLEEDEISDYEMRRGKTVASNKKPPKKHYSKGFIAVAIILVVTILFSGVLLSSVGGIVSNFTKGEEIEHIADVSSLASSGDVKNILFIGADKERGGASRSDSIMIVSVNKKVGKVIVTSILRDTHVDVPGECEAKINSAYAWGGANLLIQTIEQNFRIKIDGYAVVNFNMFTELVDGLGGIDIEVTEDEADYINNRHNYKGETKPDYVESGESVHLTGYQALWYARIRKLDSDFMRTFRQRKVIAAIAENVKKELITGNIFGLLSTAKDVAPNIETSLSQSDFTSLVFSLLGCVSKSGMEIDELLVSQQLPFDDTWWYESKWDGSSIAINVSENASLLYESIYEPTIVTETEEETTEE
ncbi:MAG: LCP family protein [Clostridia bacterium]|nr:LCP family protein [Clostridia bacterium]